MFVCAVWWFEKEAISLWSYPVWFGFAAFCRIVGLIPEPYFLLLSVYRCGSPIAVSIDMGGFEKMVYFSCSPL